MPSAWRDGRLKGGEISTSCADGAAEARKGLARVWVRLRMDGRMESKNKEGDRKEGGEEEEEEQAGWPRDGSFYVLPFAAKQGELYAPRYEWGSHSFGGERVDLISLARLIDPYVTPFTMQHDHLKVGPQLSLLFVHSVRYINFYVDFDAWNCSSTENARSREAPKGIESSSRLSPELTASILRRKSSTLSRPCDGEFVMSKSQFMFARLVLSTAMFALSNSSMQDRCIPPIRSL